MGGGPEQNVEKSLKKGDNIDSDNIDEGDNIDF
jgi:hypothetical protein